MCKVCIIPLVSKSMSWVCEQKVCIVVLQCVQFLSGWVCGWKGSHAVCVTVFWRCCTVLQCLKLVTLWVKRKPCCMCRSVFNLLYCVAVSQKIGDFVGEKETTLYVSQCVEDVILCCSLWNWVSLLVKWKPCCMWHSVLSLLYSYNAEWVSLWL